ncbi:Uncharacterised protein [uncultured archaeon]|nr:Uncharacterised protein [uncultured archaeon]
MSIITYFSGSAKGKFTVTITKGKIAFVAYCQELGIASQGKTAKEAKKNISETILIYLEEAKGSKLVNQSLQTSRFQSLT